MYGEKITCVSLVEKGNKEKDIGELYEKLAHEYQIPFSWFDFHEVCLKLRFDKVELLLEEKDVKIAMETQKYDSSDEKIKQTGVFRINCIDCLDRTNIVSKFLCLKSLERQLDSEGIIIKNRGQFKYGFSHLWANHGDKLSVQYSNTNALKGDYTRTERRGYHGVINDGILTLVRYYHGFITDYYDQVVIDFLLGNEQQDVFERYEATLENFDPNLEKEKQLGRRIFAEESVRTILGTTRNPTNPAYNIRTMIIGAWWVEANTDWHNKFELNDALLIMMDTAFILEVKTDEKIIQIDLASIDLVEYGHYYVDALSYHSKQPYRNIELFPKWKQIDNDINREQGPRIGGTTILSSLVHLTYHYLSVLYKMSEDPELEQQLEYSPTKKEYKFGLSYGMKNHLIAASGEFIGTFIFLWSAYMIAQNANSDTTYGSKGSNPAKLIMIAFGFGFGVMVGIVLTARVSGGHLNPAVTISMLLAGAVTPLRALIMIISQLVAGLAAGGAASAMTPGPVLFANALLPGVSRARGCFIECFGTCILCITVLMTCAEHSFLSDWAPAAIGISLFIGHLICVYPTGAGLNPARSLGAAVAGVPQLAIPNYFWIYWVGPILGSVIAYGIWKFWRLLDYTTCVAMPATEEEH
ncbi:hypothetical protein FOA43_001481 [Brettanomyces nanus]|uniref:SAC domain-containing protein n=1 Tax=Eeniella nana TaxID=13502 RepID=A0A875RU37_EENNA|nr:uncharacterized protein FOA43_001481 [Brettanomyces nanus]QPG74157.1 hypothetical protein FOA43_001481 [Brettanomyces nanus]